MELTSLLLADHAEAVNGKLYLVGGAWNRIAAGTLPAIHPHLTVAAVMAVPWTETNEKHALQMEVVTEDGQPVLPLPLNGEFEAGRPPGMRQGSAQNLVFCFNFNNLTLPNAGVYQFVLYVDGTELGRAGFELVVAPQPTVTA
ncbi:MAG TPA: hypothetical protein VNL71_06720 [Chloroflexota bacterium]|nr:hypothetical protein [Chloroflexota bacterium]